jgi:hypothetical protein
VLNNWRSDLGKAGRDVISELWCDNPDLFGTPADRAEYVKDSLGDMRFVYKHPDATVRN